LIVYWQAAYLAKRVCLGFLLAAQGDGQGELVVQGLEDSFHRLIAHGLAGELLGWLGVATAWVVWAGAWYVAMGVAV
jgi:hypothetical protein